MCLYKLIVTKDVCTKQSVPSCHMVYHFNIDTKSLGNDRSGSSNSRGFRFGSTRREATATRAQWRRTVKGWAAPQVKVVGGRERGAEVEATAISDGGRWHGAAGRCRMSAEGIVRRSRSCEVEERGQRRTLASPVDRIRCLTGPIWIVEETKAKIWKKKRRSWWGL
jgi:hypothetical protein